MRLSAREREIKRLIAHDGEPLRRSCEWRVRSSHFKKWVAQLARHRGEVILIVPRRGGRILLHTKPHYPHGIYRLPTGKIRPRERADTAARREAREEIGFTPKQLKLLGVMENVFRLDGKRVVYLSFLFQTEPFVGQPQPRDPEEPIAGYREVKAADLKQIAHQLRTLPSAWREWGTFRAAPHELLADLLSANEW